MDPDVINDLAKQIRELNDLLSKQAGNLSNLAQGAKQTKTVIESAANAASQATTTTNLSSHQNIKNANAVDARSKASAEADRLLAENAATFRLAALNTKSVLEQTTNALMSGEQGFTKYGGALNGLGTVATTLGKNFGILGAGLGTLLGIQFQMLSNMAIQADNVAKATDSIARLGAANSFSMKNVLDMGHRAGLSSTEFEKMTGPMQSVQGGFVGLGITQGDGIKRFGELLAVSEKTRMQYRRLGMDDQLRNQAFADYISALNMSGESFKGDLKTQRGLQIAADAYITNLYELSDLSGKSVDSLGKERMALQGDMAVILETEKLNRAEIQNNLVLKNGTPEQRKLAEKEKTRIDNERAGLKLMQDVIQARGYDQKTAHAMLTSYYANKVSPELKNFSIQGVNFQTFMDNVRAGRTSRGQALEFLTDREVRTVNAVGMVTATVNKEFASDANMGTGNIGQLQATNQQMTRNNVKADQQAKSDVEKAKESGDALQKTRDFEVETTRKLKIGTDNLLFALNPFVGSKGSILTFAALALTAASALYLIPASVAKMGSGFGLGGLGGGKDSNGPRSGKGKGPRLSAKGIGKGLIIAGAASAAIYGLSSLTGMMLEDDAPDAESLLDEYDDNEPDLADANISEIPEENQINPEDIANKQLQAINTKIVESSKKLNEISSQLTTKSMELYKKQEAERLQIISRYKFDPKIIEANSQAVASYNQAIESASDLQGSRIVDMASVITSFDTIAPKIYSDLQYFSKLDMDPMKTSTNADAFVKFADAMKTYKGGPSLLTAVKDIAVAKINLLFGNDGPIDAFKNFIDIMNSSQIDENKLMKDSTAFLNFSKAMGILSGGGRYDQSFFGATTQASQGSGGSYSSGSSGTGITVAGSDSKVLNFIGKIESGNEYNRLVGGKVKTNPPITSMTVGQVLDFQRSMKANGHESTALGKYQFIRATLQDIVKSGAIGINDIFDGPTQDKAAIHLLIRRGRDKFRAGKITIDEYANRLAQEWASLPMPNGGSAHSGVGSNKALVSRGAFIEALKARTGGVFSGPTGGYQIEMHGNEIVIPLAPDSMLYDLATKPHDDMSFTNANKTDSNIDKIISQQMIDSLAKKFDNAIYILNESDDVHDKLLRHSRV